MRLFSAVFPNVRRLACGLILLAVVVATVDRPPRAASAEPAAKPANEFKGRWVNRKTGRPAPESDLPPRPRTVRPAAHTDVTGEPVPRDASGEDAAADASLKEPRPLDVTNAKPLPGYSEKSGSGQPDGDKVMAVAFEKTEQAKSLADYTEILRLCQGVLADPDAASSHAYASELASWALNRRGQLLADQAVLAASQDPTAAAEYDQQALADFEASIQLGPERWLAYHNRGVSLALAGDLDGATADFTRTIELRPQFPKAWFNRAEIRVQSKRFREALGDYSQAIKLTSEDADAFAGRALCRRQLGDLSGALADYQQAARLDPKNAVAIVGRADTFAELRQWEPAAKDYRAAIELDPTSAAAFQGAGWLMATCPVDRYRNEDLALKAATRCVELGGASPAALDTLAAAQANRGDFAAARQTITEAIQLLPPDASQPLKNRLRLYERGVPYRQPAG